MKFSVWPPEVNSALALDGPGSGPMLEAAAAWDGIGSELSLAANAFGSVTTDLAGQAWQGPASAAMTNAAARYVDWLGGAAAQAEQSAAQARAAATAFEAALATIVDPGLITANRGHLVSLVSSNLFGQNAPAIAAVETEYERMWAQDVASMVGYHAAASVAAGQLTPWQQVPQTMAAAASETRLTLPSASPLWWAPRSVLNAIGLTQWYDTLNAQIGENWFPGTTPQVVNYPASFGIFSGSLFAPNANQSIAIGQQRLNTAIFNTTANGNSVVVAGESTGTIVIDHELAYLAADPNAPSPSQLTFVEFANPARGLVDTYLRAGTHVPIVGYTVQEPPVSQYNTAVVYSQYEGFGNPPDRPWNLLADANALMGVAYLHYPTEYAWQSQAVVVSSVTNSLGGTTTTYMIPTPTLPLLMPLQQIGVPAPVVSGLNQALMPLVNEGYSQYDPTGGPYFSQGNLV
jgi:PE-PPE domain/PPE family